MRGVGGGIGIRRAFDNDSVAQEQDPVSPRGVARVVGDDERRGARVAASPDDPQDLVPGLGVQCPRGLVGQDQPPPTDQGPGDRDALLLPSGQVVGEAPVDPARPTSASAASASRRATYAAALGVGVWSQQSRVKQSRRYPDLRHRSSLRTPTKRMDIQNACAGTPRLPCRLTVVPPCRSRARMEDSKWAEPSP